jgi:hypothetical protein
VTPIPVLVAGARMPNRKDLPQELRPLTRRNALELSELGWRQDVGRLIGTLDELLAETRPGPGLPSPERGIDTEEAAPADAAQPSDTAPPSNVAATPSGAKRAPPWTRVGRRTRWALLGAIAIAVIVVVVVVAAGGGGGGSGGEGAASSSSSDPEYQALLKNIPASIRPGCANGRNVEGQNWMIQDNQALAQATCAGGPRYLTYGLWPNPSAAREFAGLPTGFVACATSTTNEMKTILPGATETCGEKRTGDDKGTHISWNENGSPVAAKFWWHTQNQGEALKQWQKVAQAS